MAIATVMSLVMATAMANNDDKGNCDGNSKGNGIGDGNGNGDCVECPPRRAEPLDCLVERALCPLALSVVSSHSVSGDTKSYALHRHNAPLYSRTNFRSPMVIPGLQQQ